MYISHLVAPTLLLHRLIDTVGVFQARRRHSVGKEHRETERRVSNFVRSPGTYMLLGIAGVLPDAIALLGTLIAQLMMSFGFLTTTKMGGLKPEDRTEEWGKVQIGDRVAGMGMSMAAMLSDWTHGTNGTMILVIRLSVPFPNFVFRKLEFPELTSGISQAVSFGLLYLVTSHGLSKKLMVNASQERLLHLMMAGMLMLGVSSHILLDTMGENPAALIRPFYLLYLAASRSRNPPHDSTETSPPTNLPTDGPGVTPATNLAGSPFSPAAHPTLIFLLDTILSLAAIWLASLPRKTSPGSREPRLSVPPARVAGLTLSLVLAEAEWCLRRLPSSSFSTYTSPTVAGCTLISAVHDSGTAVVWELTKIFAGAWMLGRVFSGVIEDQEFKAALAAAQELLQKGMQGVREKDEPPAERSKRDSGYYEELETRDVDSPGKETHATEVPEETRAKEVPEVTHAKQVPETQKAQPRRASWSQIAVGGDRIQGDGTTRQGGKIGAGMDAEGARDTTAGHRRRLSESHGQTQRGFDGEFGAEVTPFVPVVYVAACCFGAGTHNITHGLPGCIGRGLNGLCYASLIKYAYVVLRWRGAEFERGNGGDHYGMW
ncbi:hypothetical protein BDZ91DRAFT_841560 [Kalaharituber pfeilii]|nr:hypothetical protein BDZ91DRAFT_841560 [Kalaharituber pfeilii]